MVQLVFLHGPGAGGTARSFARQLERFPGSLAPTFPGHPDGEPCPSVERSAEWLRGWLWAQGHRQNLVLAGYTLGACTALQYALDYPDEVKGLVLMTMALRLKQRNQASLELRLRAAQDPVAFEEWIEMMRGILKFVEPDFREKLLDDHRLVGPMSQYRDLQIIDGFDATDRIRCLGKPLLLVRGMDDPLDPPEYELEIHQAVPGSRYLKLHDAGHFPMAERPDDVNQAIQEFLDSLQ